jgi:hypothetical protein
MKLSLGYCGGADGRRVPVIATEDEEIIPGAELGRATYPVEVGATLTFYPDAHPESASVDGDVGHDPPQHLWTTIIALTTGDWAQASATTMSLFLISGGDTNQYVDYFIRGILCFLTSTLGAEASLLAGTFSTYGTAISDLFAAPGYICLVSSNPASATALITADLRVHGTTDYTVRKAVAAYSITGYNDWVLNAAGLAAISKTGVTKFGTRSGWDSDAVTLPWAKWVLCKATCYTAEQGNGYKPKFLVTYFVPSQDSLMGRRAGERRRQRKALR